MAVKILLSRVVANFWQEGPKLAKVDSFPNEGRGKMRKKTNATNQGKMREAGS